MLSKILKLRMENTHHSLIKNGVPEAEQVLKTGKPFWVLLSANVGIATWLMGVLVAGLNLSLVPALFVIIAGSFVGSIIPALTSVMGPRARLSQMEAGRFSLGNTGKKLPAFLNWVGTVGWDVINNIVAATALGMLLQSMGWPIPFALSLAILVVLQTAIGVYGHHLIQETARYTGALLALLFVVVGIIAMQHAGVAVTADKPVLLKEVIAGFMLMFLYNTSSWTTYTADYTRYLPANTPSRKVFIELFFSLFLSLAALAFFGYMTASAITEQTPQGVMAALQKLTGPFSGVVLFLIAFSSICSNAVNDNSGAYSLISAGVKLPRPVVAIIGSVLGYFLCLIASDSFVEVFENFLLLFAHWVTPWAAVLLTHWFVTRHDQQTPKGVTAGWVIFVVISITSVALFSSNGLYTGPVATALGGFDIGPYVGFFSAGLLYYAALHVSKKKL